VHTSPLAFRETTKNHMVNMPGEEVEPGPLMESLAESFGKGARRSEIGFDSIAFAILNDQSYQPGSVVFPVVTSLLGMTLKRKAG
jgi:hypothetical protein